MSHNLTPKHPQEHFQDEEIRDYVLTGGGAWIDTGKYTTYIRFNGDNMLILEVYLLDDLSKPLQTMTVVHPFEF